jgi:hypothetical protein
MVVVAALAVLAVVAAVAIVAAQILAPLCHGPLPGVVNANSRILPLKRYPDNRHYQAS